MALLKKAAEAAKKSPKVVDQGAEEQQPAEDQNAGEPEADSDEAQQSADQAPEPSQGAAQDAEDNDAAEDAAGPQESADQEAAEGNDEGGAGGADQGGASDSGDSSLDSMQKPATPQLQKEFERAVMALHSTLYTSTKISALVVKMVQPLQIVDSTSKACILVVDQLDRKLHLDAQVIPQFTMATVDEVMDLIQQVKQVKYSEPQQKAILGATFEGVMKIFGVPPAEAKQFMASLSDQQKGAARKAYVSNLNDAKTASPSAEADTSQGPPAAGGTPPEAEAEGGEPEGGEAEPEAGGEPAEPTAGAEPQPAAPPQEGQPNG